MLNIFIIWLTIVWGIYLVWGVVSLIVWIDERLHPPKRIDWTKVFNGDKNYWKK